MSFGMHIVSPPSMNPTTNSGILECFATVTFKKLYERLLLYAIVQILNDKCVKQILNETYQMLRFATIFVSF